MKKFIVWIFALNCILTLLVGCGDQLTSKNTTMEATLLTEDDNESTDEMPGNTISEPKTDTGKYLGQVDSNFIEIHISGVPDDLDPTVFMLSDDIKDSFESRVYSVGDNLRFEYYINENDQKVIIRIEKI